MPASNKRPLFRETALQQYMRSQEKDVLPRLITPPTFLCGWMLLGLLVFVGIVAWWQEIPIFASGSAMVLTGEAGSAPPYRAQVGYSAILLFLPTRYDGQLRVGEHCHLRLYDSAPYLPCTVTSVARGALHPDTIQTNYKLNEIGLTRPVLVAEARLQAPLTEDTRVNEQVEAQVEIGTRRLLTILPGFDKP